MKFLMICANQYKHPWPVIPFGACSVAQAVKDAAYDVKVLDLCFVDDPQAEIKEEIASFGPDAVGISIRNIDDGCAFDPIFFLPDVNNRIVAPLKETFDGPIIIGGPAVGINAEEMLRMFGLSYACVGDGEAVALDFLDAVAGNRDMNQIDGLFIRSVTGVVKYAKPRRQHNLDSFPLPKIHKLIDISEYRRYDVHIQVQTKRGCALACTYCTYNGIEGAQYRCRDPRSVADYIESVVNETGIDQFEFTDSTFNIPLDHAKSTLRAIIAKKLNLRLRTMGLNPSAVDEELVDLMCKAGFMEVDLGVESLSDQVLKSLGKNFSVSDILTAADILRKKKVPTNWFLMFGASEETTATVAETIQNVHRAARFWDFVTIGTGIRVYKGSTLATRCLAKNPTCTTDGFLTPLALEPDAISLDQVQLMVRMAATRYPNFFVYGPDTSMPPPAIVKLTFKVFRMFTKRQPVWCLQILINVFKIILGMNLLKRCAFRRLLVTADLKRASITKKAA